MPEEMSETLLTNKKQESLCKVHADNIVTPTQTRIYREKYTFCFLKLLKYFKNLKTMRDAYSGLYVSIFVIKSPIHLVRQSL